MHKFELAIEILDVILEQNIPFNLATKNVLDKYSIPQDERTHVVGVVGCELRHHLLFDAIVKDEIALEEGVSKSSILLLLANYHFYNKFDNEEAIAITARATNLDTKFLKEFLDKHNDKNGLIPARYEKGSFEYLSLRYNCPVWLVKMLNKHFGRGIAFKILQINTRPLVQTFALNGVEQGEILTDPNYTNAPVEGMVTYIGKGGAKNNKFFKEKKIIPEKMAFKATLDSINVKPMSNIAFFSGYSNTTYLDLALRLKEGSHIDIITPEISLTNEVKRHVNIYGLKNASIYEEKAANMLAVVSNKVDYFFLLARNSNLELLRTNADYFLQFNRDSLDGLMNEQRYSLDEAASLVNDGGELIYMIPTLNKKESKQIIAEFLLIHPEFSLLDERQHFPFEDYNSTLYVARMLKTNKK